MIYTSRGFITKNMVPVETNQTDWEYLTTYEPKQMPHENMEQVEKFKKSQAEYFLSGEMALNTVTNQYERSNHNLIGKRIIALDYDDIDMLLTKFIHTIKEKLQDIDFMLYPTIRNNFDGYGLRYRLLINTDRLYSESESKTLLTNVINHIGLKCDSASKTFSQPMGLPLINAYSNKKMIIVNQGTPLVIDDYMTPLEVKEPITVNYQQSELTDSEYIDMFNQYAKRNESSLSDYSFYLNAYMCLKHGVQSNEISQEIAEVGLMVLAGDDVEWQKNNVNHFRQDKAVSRLKKPVKEYFGTKGKAKLLEGEELKNALFERRQEELAYMMKQWEENGSKGRKPSLISPIRVAIVLKDYLKFCLFDMNENTKLAVYRPNEGIYTQNETYIRRIISWLEPKHNSSKASDVIYHLKNMADIREKTISRYLIPVNNGIFNLQTKTLEAFSYKKVFTSKIATNYVKPNNKPIIDGWDVDEWMKSIANNDTEIEYLLWQVISASLNGNFSRRQSLWLVGSGNNGKGTYQTLIKHLVGSKNIATLKLPDFQGRFNLSLLEEKVVCIGDDVPAGVYIDDSSNFNSVVTGDDVMVEEKNKPAYSTNFQMTIIQSTNSMPKIHNKTEGTYRRIVIVPFSANFKGQGDNWKIKDEYIKNKNVLEYVLFKAINMDFERFTVPSESERLMKDYKQVNDPMVDFKENIFDNLNLNKIPFYIVYGYYKDFCHDNNFQPMSKIKFSKEFESLLDDGWSKYSKKYSKGEINNLPNKPYNIDYPIHGKTYMYYINERLKVM
ncbi:phage/plasmid primase, P4 family [Enterococcus sp. FR169]|uniref:DNA primase family protein n=1 Tax=Enterococcus sp. FR169 TaxID=2923505 RepID=UPI00280F1B56|nr:phage/plasmid primase, P4 family [Enterococcus sp. FR169]MDQ8644371.1 phage/plasmid primase, P4 family [Enterococcus sp. FR169]